MAEVPRLPGWKVRDRNQIRRTTALRTGFGIVRDRGQRQCQPAGVRKKFHLLLADGTSRWVVLIDTEWAKCGTTWGAEEANPLFFE